MFWKLTITFVCLYQARTWILATTFVCLYQARIWILAITFVCLYQARTWILATTFVCLYQASTWILAITFACLYQARFWIFIVICRGLFMFNELRWSKYNFSFHNITNYIILYKLMNTEIQKIKLQINITKCQWSKINKRQSKPKGQSRMDNPEKLATLGTHDTGQRLEKS